MVVLVMFVCYCDMFRIVSWVLFVMCLRHVSYSVQIACMDILKRRCICMYVCIIFCNLKCYYDILFLCKKLVYVHKSLCLNYEVLFTCLYLYFQ
jgi:hypothetical protein